MGVDIRGRAAYAPFRGKDGLRGLSYVTKMLGAVGAIIGAIAAGIVTYTYWEERTTVDLTGTWKIVDTIEKSEYKDYIGLEVGFIVMITQDGQNITGHGDKWSENGKEIPPSSRTRIVLEGKIDGEKVTAIFEEKGHKRETGGLFKWRVSSDANTLSGSFESTAARTSGKSIATRLDNLE